MTLTEQISKLFTGPAPEPLHLDLTIPWHQQPDYLELTAQVTAATTIFNAAQIAYTKSENLTEPNRAVWQSTEINELDFLHALRDRQAIKDHYLSAKVAHVDLLTQQTALGSRIRQEMFKRRCASPVRRELVKHVDGLLDPVVSANTALFLYEQQTKVLSGCEFAQDTQLYLRELLDPEQSGRPSQWRSFCRQECM